MSDLEEPKSGVSRRTVAKAMAWSVPAVALAVPAPAYAASPCVPTISLGPTSCKCPGQSTGSPWTYFLTFCADIAPGCEVPPGTTLSITAVNSKSGGPGGTPLGTPNGSPYPILVPVGDCNNTEYEFTSTNSANFLLITFEYGGSLMTVEVPSPPDCDNCAERLA